MRGVAISNILAKVTRQVGAELILAKVTSLQQLMMLQAAARAVEATTYPKYVLAAVHLDNRGSFVRVLVHRAPLRR